MTGIVVGAVGTPCQGLFRAFVNPPATSGLLGYSEGGRNVTIV